MRFSVLESAKLGAVKAGDGEQEKFTAENSEMSGGGVAFEAPIAEGPPNEIYDLAAFHHSSQE